MRRGFPALAVLLVLLGVAATAHGEWFRIAWVGPERDLFESETNALIAGGYVHGLDRGMQGNIFTVDKDGDTLITGTAEIVDVGKWESACRIRPLLGGLVIPGQKVVLKPLAASQEMFIRTGQEAFDAGDFERAEFFLSTAMKHGTPDEVTRLSSLVEKSRQEIESERERKLKKKEKKQERRKKTAYELLARIYFSEHVFQAAEQYAHKILRISPRDKFAKNIIENIQQTRSREAREGGAESKPEAVRLTTPAYPNVARRADIEGVVWIKAFLNTAGKILWAEVHKSSGSPILDKTAIRAAYENEFEPATRNGEPENCWITYRMTFELEG